MSSLSGRPSRKPPPVVVLPNGRQRLRRNVAVEVEPGRHVMAQEIGIGERQVVGLVVLAAADRNPQGLAAAEEVGFLHRDFGDQALGGRHAGGDRERTGRLVLDVDDDDHLVGRRPLPGRDRHGLEVAERAQAAFSLVDQHPVVCVAFGNIELAANDVIAGLGVAADFDALDIGARALVDHVGDRDDVVGVVAIAARLHLGEHVALPRKLDGQILDGFLDFG